MDYLVLRIVCSLITGIVLSQAGSFIQVGTRNILASPSTLGFDGLAVLWCLVFHSVVLAFFPEYALLGVSLILGLPIFILLGLIFSRLLKGRERFERIILLGLTFNLLVGAIFSLWQFLFLAFNLPFPMELWFGHFRFVSPEAMIYLLLTEVLIVSGYLWLKRDINLFTLGSLAKNWEIDERRLYGFFFCTVAVGTFVVVSLFGGFSFLGLIFPIIARNLWFKKYGFKGEFVFGSLMNGIFLMAIDLLCYQFPIMGAEIPVGLIVTAIGAVSLILLLWRGRGHGIIGKA